MFGRTCWRFLPKTTENHLFCLYFGCFGLKTLTHYGRTQLERHQFLLFLAALTLSHKCAPLGRWSGNKSWVLERAASGATTPPQQIGPRLAAGPARANTRSPNDNIIVEGDSVCLCCCVLSEVRGGGGAGRVVIWASSRERNKCSQGDSLPHRDGRKTSAPPVTEGRKGLHVCLSGRSKRVPVPVDHNNSHNQNDGSAFQ